MFKRRYKYILFSVIAVAVFLAMGFTYYNMEKDRYDGYQFFKNGEKEFAYAFALNAETHDPNALEKWRLEITINNKTYVSVTDGKYTEAEIKRSNYRVEVIYYLSKGQPVVYNEKSTPLSDEDKARGIAGYLVTTDASFFKDRKAPGFNGSIFLFSLCGVSCLLAVYHFIMLSIYKSVDKKGIFVYALFVEAAPTMFGSLRRLKVRYRYKNEAGDWLEALSPPQYSANDADKLKSLDAIGIKYHGRRSIIVENIKLL